MIDEMSRVRQNSRVAYRQLDKGGVLLHLDTGQYHGVNATGRLIWSNLTGSTVSVLVDQVRGELEHAPDDLDEDIIQFLRALHERGLIELDVEPHPKSR